MKSILMLICSLVALSLMANAAAEPQVFSTSAGPVKITPIYHASTLIQAGGKAIYVDPAKPAKLDGLPKADLILVTHMHWDHFDPNSIATISQSGTLVIAPASVVEKFPSAKSMANDQSRQWEQWTIETV